jgi:DNA-binding transcriptional regulator YbjK
MTDPEDPQSLRDRIVDAAIDLAEREGWEHLRLWKVVERCGVDLTGVLSEFRDIDAVSTRGSNGRSPPCFNRPNRDSRNGPQTSGSMP